jgi:hypothetical protein
LSLDKECHFSGPQAKQEFICKSLNGTTDENIKGSKNRLVRDRMKNKRKITKKFQRFAEDY